MGPDQGLWRDRATPGRQGRRRGPAAREGQPLAGRTVAPASQKVREGQEVILVTTSCQTLNSHYATCSRDSKKCSQFASACAFRTHARSLFLVFMKNNML